MNTHNMFTGSNNKDEQLNIYLLTMLLNIAFISICLMEIVI